MSNQETTQRLKRYFVHRSDVYTIMTYNRYQRRHNYYDRVFAPLTDQVLEDHLNGEITIALFPTDLSTQTTKFVCWDIDTGQDIDLARVLAVCNKLELKPVIEASGRENGFHVWHFFTEPQPIKEVRKMRGACSLTGIDFFPERDLVINDFYFELPIKLPLGFHRKEGTWSKFVSREGIELSLREALTAAGYERD